jgi:hypothetical protein
VTIHHNYGNYDKNKHRWKYVTSNFDKSEHVIANLRENRQEVVEYRTLCLQNTYQKWHRYVNLFVSITVCSPAKRLSKLGK